jgi:PhoPQ-activated pathogenicity-related protein
VLYVPNAGHGLEQQFADGSRPNRERALNALAAFTRHIIKDNPVPRLSWKHDDANGKARLTVEARPGPLAARLWVARAATRDFRRAQFNEQPLLVVSEKGDGGTLVGEVPFPKEGNLSFFAELDYEIDGLKHQLSTQLRIVEPVP